MKQVLKFFLPLFIIGCLVGVGTGIAHGAEPIPNPRGFVNDFANIISDDAQHRMEQMLYDYKTRTTNEIAVVTVSSLGGESIEEYTIRLAEKWKVGKRGKENGVILLVAPNDRETRIEVGYGLEGVLTDAKSKLIIERAMIPEFKKGNFASGIEKGLAEIMQTLTPAGSAEDNPKNQPDEHVQANETKKKEINGAMVGFVFAGIAGAILMIVLMWLLFRAWGRWRAEVARSNQVRHETHEIIARIRKNIPAEDKR